MDCSTASGGILAGLWRCLSVCPRDLWKIGWTSGACEKRRPYLVRCSPSSLLCEGLVLGARRGLENGDPLRADYGLAFGARSVPLWRWGNVQSRMGLH